MKKRSVFLLLAGLGAILSLPFLLFVESEVLFQSLESVTEKGEPVFNRVQFQRKGHLDIWRMRQSHHGIKAGSGEWDQLAIVVDRSTTPKQAKFYQLEGDRAIPLKARCLACHSNGPRALRPKWDSPQVSSKFRDRMQVMVWNLKIKAYGRIQSLAGVEVSDSVPFRSRHKILSQPLLMKSCLPCHAKDGIRNELTFEQLGTAGFLVREGLMPPFPFQISKEDESAFQRLVR